MKKKALKIVLPLSLVAVLLIGLLVFHLIPPEQSNFRFTLNAHYLDENGYLIDDANTYSYEDSRREENNSLICPVGSTLQFRMMMGQQDKRWYKTVYRGTQFIDVEISKGETVLYTPDFSEKHSRTLPNLMGRKTLWSVADCYNSYTFAEAGTYTVIARSKFKTKGKNFGCSTYPLTIIVE